MQCSEASEQMALRLDGELPPQQAVELDRHLADCVTCDCLWRKLLRAEALLAQVAHEPAPVALAAQVMQRVRRRAAWLAWARGAVLVVLVSAIGLALAFLPAAAVMGLALDAPTLLRAAITLITSVWGVASAVVAAVAVVLRSALAGSAWLWLLGGATLAVILLWQWVRLVVGRPGLGSEPAAGM